MPDAFARIAMTVAAGLAALGCGIVAVWLLPASSPFQAAYPMGACFVLGSVVVVACCLIWRRFVAWTRARTGGTAAMSAALLAHALLGLPLFSLQGCGAEEALVVNQCLALTGVWWAGCGALWWSRWRRQRPPLENMHDSGRHSMSPSATRLAVSLALIPFLLGFNGVVWAAIQVFFSGNHIAAALVPGAVGTVIMLAATLALWRSRVIWTLRRVRVTAALAAVALVAQASPLLGNLESNAPSGLWGALAAAASLALPLFGLAAWVGGVAWLWRYRPGELPPGANAALFDPSTLSRCPACQYSLVGLHEVRCPECGWRATVDQLLRVKLAEALDTA